MSVRFETFQHRDDWGKPFQSVRICWSVSERLLNNGSQCAPSHSKSQLPPLSQWTEGRTRAQFRCSLTPTSAVRGARSELRTLTNTGSDSSERRHAWWRSASVRITSAWGTISPQLKFPQAGSFDAVLESLTCKHWHVFFFFETSG